MREEEIDVINQIVFDLSSDQWIYDICGRKSSVKWMDLSTLGERIRPIPLSLFDKKYRAYADGISGSPDNIFHWISSSRVIIFIGIKYKKVSKRKSTLYNTSN